MTAFPLFDLFAANANSLPAESAKQERERQLMTVAASMVAIAIQQFEKIRALDEALASPREVEDAAFNTDAAVGLRLMYDEAAQDADRILDRIDRLERRTKKVVTGSNELRDWHGKTMAMLSVSLEDIARGIEQAKRGEVVPASVLRNELRNRLHC
jgi:hypothetical protein